MQINNLKRNKNNRKARKIGRGGKRGKTSGHGTKGQNARAGRKKRPEIRDFIKRIPKLRGRGKNYLKSRSSKPVVLDVSLVAQKFSDGQTVNRTSLLEKGLISLKNGKIPSVKILGKEQISKILTIENLKISDGAKNSVVKAGGKIIPS